MSRRKRKYVSTYSPEIDIINDDFDENVRSFIRDLKFRNRSKHTIEYYRRELRKFMHTLEDMRLKTNLRAITSDLIKGEYVRYMSEEKGARHTTIAATLRALRAFLNWSVQNSIIENNPMDDVTVGDPKARTIETFTRDQIRLLFSQADPK